MTATTGMIKYLNQRIKQTVVQEWETLSLLFVLSITHVAISVLTGTEVWLKEKVLALQTGRKDFVTLILLMMNIDVYNLIQM